MSYICFQLNQTQDRTATAVAIFFYVSSVNRRNKKLSANRRRRRISHAWDSHNSHHASPHFVSDENKAPCKGYSTPGGSPSRLLLQHVLAYERHARPVGVHGRDPSALIVWGGGLVYRQDSPVELLFRFQSLRFDALRSTPCPDLRSCMASSSADFVQLQIFLFPSLCRGGLQCNYILMLH